MLRMKSGWIVGLLLASGGPVLADLPPDAPRPLPLTRPEMKKLIEDVKVRTPRIPLPELTDADREALGESADSYESRLRYHFMTGIDDGRGGSRTGRSGQGDRRNRGSQREQDPDMTLDNAFKVELFWIVSRTNNCQYCLGHQESKLLAAGLSEDTIAALDLDWSGFKTAEQVAFAFARKFTYEPHQLSDADIDGLRVHFTDKQILEMILSMAGNNSINRWKEGVGVPQRSDEGGYSRVDVAADASAADQTAAASRPRGTYLTPTSAAFADRISIVAPLTTDPATGKPTTATVSSRPALEPRGQVEKALASAKGRAPRLPLVDEDEARKALGDKWDASAPLPNWVRLLSNFPRTGVTRVASIRSSNEKGDLSPLLKAQMSWIIARQDRAWYATGESYRRLREQGQSDEQIFALDGDWKGFTPREQALFTVAKKLGASPVVLTDSEVTKAVELAGPRDVVQAVSYTTQRASFNRITEAAGLPIEP
jgi:alkylhydroperoxidase family enzyme